MKELLGFLIFFFYSFCIVLNILQCACTSWYWEDESFSFWKKSIWIWKKIVSPHPHFFNASFKYTLLSFHPPSLPSPSFFHWNWSCLFCTLCYSLIVVFVYNLSVPTGPPPDLSSLGIEAFSRPIHCYIFWP